MKPASLAPRPVIAGAALLLCVVLGVGACSDGGGADPGSTAPPSSAPPLPTGEPRELQVRTRTTIGRVVGRFGRSDQRRLAGVVTEVVQRWFDAAYVGGDYPRKRFGDAFPGFTPAAQQRARRDQRLLTNRTLGPQITGVTPTRSRLALDVLAVRKRAVGVTARFRLDFRTEGARERKVRVRGRLLLTRQPAGWRIFAYDVSKGGRPA